VKEDLRVMKLFHPIAGRAKETIWDPADRRLDHVRSFWAPGMTARARIGNDGHDRLEDRDGGRESKSAFASLFGASRARMLLALSEPRTTAELASRFALAPSTVSGHLHALHRAGVVERARRGRYVFYRLNARGRALVALVAERDRAP
jgi:DNA-binding transcriptional ArsR family regulator